MLPTLKHQKTCFSILRRTMTSNLHRPASWKEAAPPPLPGPTFAAQASLPKLPVPELADTLARLKESLRPLAWNEKEWERVVERIDEFGVKYGPPLQERLIERAKEKPHWLEEWWDDTAYLGYRDTVVINVSYYYGFKDHPQHFPQHWRHRAASIIRATMVFRQRFKRGEIPPEATKEGPICMDSWRWMFDCCRIPGQEKFDWSVSYAKPGDDGSSGHIVVFRRGRVWKLEPWQNGRLLSVSELEKQLQYIADSTTEEYPQVSVLAAAKRDRWAENYAALEQDPHNAEILKTIHSAAFVVSLDNAKPENIVEHSEWLLHGGKFKEKHEHAYLGLRNRWVDKPVNFVIYDNAKAGIMGEHSVMDGTPTVALCDGVLNMIADPSFDQGTDGDAPTALPVPMEWHITEPLAREMLSAVHKTITLIKNQMLDVVRTPYGKAAIKQFGVSPDSWAQMVVQLAYTRLLARSRTKRRGGTYEAAMTRRFYKGRTEAIRVVTSESDAWVRSMIDRDADDATRLQLFQAATRKHVELAKLAGNGLGVDRHMFGLQQLVRKEDKKSVLFDDPVYKRAKNWVVSTSAVFSTHFGPYGWGQVVDDGFGVAYMTGFDDYLQFTITSKKDSPHRIFCSLIQQAAQELYDLHANNTTPKSNL